MSNFLFCLSIFSLSYHIKVLITLKVQCCCTRYNAIKRGFSSPPSLRVHTWIITQPPYSHNFCRSKMAFNNRALLYCIWGSYGIKKQIMVVLKEHIGRKQGDPSGVIFSGLLWSHQRLEISPEIVVI